jgi:hypothetical protein
VALIRERIATGVPKHVGMGLERQLGDLARSFDHACEASRREWRPALRREYEWRLGVLFAVQPSQGTKFIAKDRVGAGRTLLDPAGVHRARPEVHLIPPKVR